jgi:hypothetical protein
MGRTHLIKKGMRKLVTLRKAEQICAQLGFLYMKKRIILSIPAQLDIRLFGALVDWNLSLF